MDYYTTRGGLIDWLNDRIMGSARCCEWRSAYSMCEWVRRRDVCISLALSLSHQSDESYRRGVHINRRSSHILSVIFIHNPNRISILTSEFPPLLKQVDLLSVVLLTWIFNPRVVYIRPGYHGYGYERLNWYTEQIFSLFELTTCCFYNIFSFFAFLSTSHFRLFCDTVLKPRISFFKTTAHCCQSKIWQI